MAFALVASVQTPGGATGGTSAAIDTTGANLLTFNASYFGTAGVTISDSKGNTWALRKNDGVAVDNNTDSLYDCLNPTVGTGHTFTVGTPGGSNYSVGQIAAWSGATTPATVDGTPTGTAVAALTVQPGSRTPGQAGSLFVTGFSGHEVTGVTINSGFTIAGQTNTVGGVNYSGAMAYLIQGAAAAINPTWTATDATGNHATMAVYIPAAGGGVFTASISDTHASSDATTAAMLATASRSDSHVSSDALTGVAQASTSDTVTTSDATAPTFLATASTSDTAASSDTLTGVAVASSADTLVTSDATTPVMLAVASPTDTLATSDATTGAAVATLADTLASSDTLTGIMVSFATLRTDSAATSDVSTASMLVVVGVADTAASSDALTGGAMAALADFLASSEGYASVVGMVASVTDTLVTSDHLTGSGIVIQVYPAIATVAASNILTIAKTSPTLTITLAALVKSIMPG